MKNILDYPENTRASGLPKELLDLHEERGAKTVEALGGQEAFFMLIKSKPAGDWILDYKEKFEEVNGTKFSQQHHFWNIRKIS
ncbi:hypothetical protein 44RRORF213c [Aeromonas phage 44RR2.8t]|uniref:Uncharacterized protein n=2 Tax=Biquartavirus 44RR2 TaxID=115987 RepID=Q6U989_9CAUD|nr:hypothetical protein ST44RRORF213c [Aeromonas phage 44RR2.8t]AAQ81531.1 hypothetical protein 44RRORF213c [Aeromonas phage 44RR2.8t]APU00685.1 hypothetical protein [Aeromonas phage 44RR2.8t.2]